MATPRSLARAQWYGYGLGFEPVTYFDGGDAAPQETLYETFRNRIEAARSRKTMFEMALDTAVTGIEGGNVRVGVRIKTLDTLVNDMNSLMLVPVLFLDSVGHYSLSGDTAYAPIAVEVIGGPWGVPARLRYATDFDTVFAVPAGNWREDRLGVAVFIQDTTTKQVMQTVVTRKLARQ
ncbi:MAG: hypothetical protein R6X14_05310 [bacterium]